ncbi:MAG: L,D-transpeptidase family protein [Myxococcota bacterium]
MSSPARLRLRAARLGATLRRVLLASLTVSACARVHEPRPTLEIPAERSEVPRIQHHVVQREVARPVLEPAVVQESEIVSREVVETVMVRGGATVRAEPRPDAPALGQLALGAAVEVYGRVDGTGCMFPWLEVAPQGFVCARSESTSAAPTPMLPSLPGRATLPGIYGSLTKGSKVYDSLDAALAGEGGRVPSSHLTLRRQSATRRGSASAWKTRYGWVREQDLRRLKPSRFHGELVEGLEQPLAWTLPPQGTRSVLVRATAQADAAVVAQLGPRVARPVLEVRDGFVRVEEGWLLREQVRVARRRTAPTPVGPRERWIDVDLTEQVLVAYEGEVPVYATLVSSGRPGHRTPTGIFRISKKVAERTMNSMADSSDRYSVDRVPWTAYFDHGYAFHAAFWHGGFGRTRSHGCVNLSPTDARALYDWMSPAAAPGWSEVYGHEDQPGALVRLHDGQREPEWKGYAKAMHEAAADGAGDDAPVLLARR